MARSPWVSSDIMIQHGHPPTEEWRKGWRSEDHPGIAVVSSTRSARRDAAGAVIVEPPTHDYSGWRLIHTASGLQIASVKGKTEGIRLAGLLIETPVNWSRPAADVGPQCQAHASAWPILGTLTAYGDVIVPPTIGYLPVPDPEAEVPFCLVPAALLRDVLSNDVLDFDGYQVRRKDLPDGQVATIRAYLGAIRGDYVSVSVERDLPVRLPPTPKGRAEALKSAYPPGRCYVIRVAGSSNAGKCRYSARMFLSLNIQACVVDNRVPLGMAMAA